MEQYDSLVELDVALYVRELDLLPSEVVVALGAKARGRMKGLKREVVEAVAAAPPGCNRRDARSSGQAAAARVRGAP